MSNNDAVQSVATPANDAAKAAPATDGAQDQSLDVLLKEYDEAQSGTAGDPAKAPAGGDAGSGSEPTLEGLARTVDDLQTALHQQRQAEIQALIRADVAKAVGVVRSALGEVPVQLSDRIIEGWLNQRAMEDRRFVNAFLKRGDHPARWQQILAAAASELRTELAPASQRDAALSDARAAATAAVRTASTKAGEPPPDLRTMSDRDFESHVRGLVRR